ncbi:hypothetical protein Goari_014738 [Gossypium aridum]|uniref:Uncharacterized protein n=1 Tax=Gossypium aridum TaxID=34290 RepID=A0A7J8XIV2_GOSAI|nr:hypothetical protein [Gossypium aridum]
MRIFGSHSNTKAISYRSLSHNVQKYELSMSAYLAETKHLYDSLARCGQRVIMEEQQSTILNGLLLEFDHAVSIISTSRVPFDLQGVTTALLDAEARQQGHLSRDFARRCFYRYDSVSKDEGENPSTKDDSEHSSWVGFAYHVGRKPVTAYMCCADGGSHWSGLQPPYYASDPAACGPLR